MRYAAYYYISIHISIPVYRAGPRKAGHITVSGRNYVIATTVEYYSMVLIHSIFILHIDCVDIDKYNAVWW